MLIGILSFFDKISLLDVGIVFLILWCIWVLFLYRKQLLRNKGNAGDGPPPDGPDQPPGRRVWSYSDHPAEEEPPPFDIPVRSPSPQVVPIPESAMEMFDEPEEGQYEALEQALDDISKVITDNKEIGNNIGLLALLKPIIEQYPQLNHPTFRAAFFNMISRAAFNECGLSLTRAEVEGMWNS